MVSEAWKKLTPEERKIWEDKAEEDKVRYQQEKNLFKDTWKVKKRKDPTAPKRPSSAYLAFSNSRRAEATRDNPLATNAEVSKILGKMWRECPPDIKKKYVDEELKLREQYKIDMAKWKQEQKEIKRNNRKVAAAEAKKAKTLGELAINNSDYHEEMLNPTPLRLALPNSSINVNNSYSRLLAAAGMNTGLGTLGVTSIHGDSSSSAVTNNNLLFGNDNFNYGKTNQSADQQKQHQVVQNNASAFRSPLAAFLVGPNEPSFSGAANAAVTVGQSQQQQHPQQSQQMLHYQTMPSATATSNVSSNRNNFNLVDVANFDFTDNVNMGNLNAGHQVQEPNQQQAKTNGSDAQPDALDVQSLLALNSMLFDSNHNHNTNTETNHQNAFSNNVF